MTTQQVHRRHRWSLRVTSCTMLVTPDWTIRIDKHTVKFKTKLVKARKVKYINFCPTTPVKLTEASTEHISFLSATDLLVWARNFIMYVFNVFYVLLTKMLFISCFPCYFRVACLLGWLQLSRIKVIAPFSSNRKLTLVILCSCSVFVIRQHFC